jgi:hypothetical protein
MKRVRVGNGCGFWGDNLDAPARLARDGRLDYLTLEYLAELTMSILAVQKAKDPGAGYATDFIDVLRTLAGALRDQPNLKVVTNAGGMNPHACALRAKQVLADAGLADARVAVVSGDDLMPRLDELLAAGHALNHLDTGEPLAAVRDRVVSANAYLGARPIADALGLGARVVVTGRVADASLTVGPAAHEFGWGFGPADLDRLAAATVAGHLIECGAQVTGGLWLNADDSTRLAEVGYPVAEIAGDGSFTVSKPAGSGGAVNLETVSEQLLYEVADPARYYTPDVVADFTTVKLGPTGGGRGRVTGGTGNGVTDSYKVSVSYRDGFMSAGTLVIAGPNAAAKARRSGAILLDRLKQAGLTYAETRIEALGAGDCVPGVVKAEFDPPEVVLRVAVRDPRRAAVERFTKEFAPLVTGGLPGTTGYTTGRPPVREVFAYWPALVAKSAVTPLGGAGVMATLSQIAHGRSGDKGSHANVAVIAYTDAGFAWLREHLTAEVVAAYFAPLGPTRVERFEAANVRALNFVLYDVLAGGAEPLAAHRHAGQDARGGASCGWKWTCRRSLSASGGREPPESCSPRGLTPPARPGGPHVRPCHLRAARPGGGGHAQPPGQAERAVARADRATERRVPAGVERRRGPVRHPDRDRAGVLRRDGPRRAALDPRPRRRQGVGRRRPAVVAVRTHLHPAEADGGRGERDRGRRRGRASHRVRPRGERPDAKFGYPEVRRGLVAAMVLPHLLRHVGERTARWLLLTGELIDGLAALRVGLVNQICSAETLLATADAWAVSLAEGGPKALATTKDLLRRCSRQGVAVDELARASAEPRLTDECHHGLSAFSDKRPAPWSPK